MSAPSQIPPIVKAAENLWHGIDKAVELFPQRKHRYGIGVRLSDLAFEVYTLANRAWRDRRQQPLLVDRLKWKVDDLKLCMEMAKRRRAYNGKGIYFHLALQAEQLGAQVGGWHKKLFPGDAQNARTGSGHAQRGKKLSDCGASESGANP